MLIRLSRESEYAVAALTVLAGRPAGTVMIVRDIAAAAQLPASLLARTFQRLGRHGLVRAHRGAVRGYALAVPPSQITLLAVFEAVEGPAILGRCVFSSSRCPRPDPCRLHPVWSALRPALEQVMAQTTLDTLGQHREPGAGRTTMTTDTAFSSLEAYFDAQARSLTDRCTRCGKCVEVCPIVHTEHSPVPAADPVPVVTGIVDYLRGETLPDPARVWAEACMGSGECITHCPERINPRLMLGIAVSRIRADKTARGENPTADFFKRMSQIINLATGMQMSPDRYRRLIGREGNPATAEVVMYLGCNVLRTPVIVFSLMDILDRLEVDYAMLGGVANCCGLVHLKLGGDIDGTDVIASRTIEKLGALRPRTVLHWCPSCVLQFGETIDGYRAHAFEFTHVSRFLANNLGRLTSKLVRPVPQRVALHRHDAGLGIYDDVKRLLEAVPGLELVPIEEHHHWAYSCGPGALANLPGAREQAHRQSVRSAVDAGAGVLVTLYHTCHRDLCVFEGQYPIQVKNWTSLLATALGLPEHDDLYKRYKLHADVNAILADASEFIEANGIDVSAVREILPRLLEGKDRGLSVW